MSNALAISGKELSAAVEGKRSGYASVTEARVTMPDLWLMLPSITS